MTKLVTNNDNRAFFSPGRDIFRVAVRGLVFGLLLALLPFLFYFVTCRVMNADRCLGDTIQTYRISLVVASFLILLAMLLSKLDRPIYIILPALIIFWNLFLPFDSWLIRTLIYGFLGTAVFAVFGWLSRINNWLASLVLTILVTIILFLIVR